MGKILGDYYFLTDYPRVPLVDRLRVAEDFRPQGWYRRSDDKPADRTDLAIIGREMAEADAIRKAHNGSQQDEDNLARWRAEGWI